MTNTFESTQEKFEAEVIELYEACGRGEVSLAEWTTRVRDKIREYKITNEAELSIDVYTLWESLRRRCV